MEAVLRINEHKAVKALEKAILEFRDAADEDEIVDGDQVVDVFGETDVDSSFVFDLVAAALVSAGVLEKQDRAYKLDRAKLEAFLASFKAR